MSDELGMDDLIRMSFSSKNNDSSDELMKLIHEHLPDGLPEWEKVFPEEFFEQLERLYGSDRAVSKNKGLFYAKFMTKYIYDAVEQLKDEREELGMYLLRGIIWQVLGVMKVSSNKRVFEGNYARLMAQS